MSRPPAKLHPRVTAEWDPFNRVGQDSQLAVSPAPARPAVLPQSFELPKAIHMESECFSVDNELMTPTFELRRTQLLRRYEPQVGSGRRLLWCRADHACCALPADQLMSRRWVSLAPRSIESPLPAYPLTAAGGSTL